jgi:hypothetical protein
MPLEIKNLKFFYLLSRLNQIEINGHSNNSEPILGANSSIQIKNNKLKGLMR